MNLVHPFWYFKEALPNHICDEIIKYGNLQREQLAITGFLNKKLDEGKNLSEEDVKDLKKKRDSNIAWLNDNWIYDEILPFVHLANKNAGWNFDWDYSESCQFTKYKINQYYDWHNDAWDEPYNKLNDLNYHGKIRKLSVTCSLSFPEDYEGGELEFDLRKVDPDKPQETRICNEIKPRGSIVVFPSHIWHRVKPVTKGIRYSLVVWNLGKPFK